MSLRAHGVEQSARLPDGRTAVVRIGVPDDDYVDRRELETVALELRLDGRLEASLNTILNPDQESEALKLAREIAAGLESGTLEPTAGALEPFADEVPAT
ncbi:MAG TPA: hypothetical protein VJT84_13330 [Gaiellaceae bacterium]|nr:hypothetical protein [Gaiellaceae bacterium]